MPSLSAIASGTYGDNWKHSNPYDVNGNVGLRLSWPLFSGLSTMYQVDQAKFLYQQSQKNLDNQNFEEITQRAVSRIPEFSDNWTNFNLSDPGITLIDLFAWYKEMEQYELNFYTESIAERLLRLTGIERLHSRAAECMIHISPELKEYHPKFSRLETKEGIIFETEEEIPEKIPVISGIYIGEKDGLVDVTGILNEGVGIHPFAEGDLILEFENTGDRKSVV